MALDCTCLAALVADSTLLIRSSSLFWAWHRPHQISATCIAATPVLLAHQQRKLGRMQDTNVVLAISRIMVAWQPVGLAMGVYDMANRYLRQREQFGNPLAAYQVGNLYHAPAAPCNCGMAAAAKSPRLLNTRCAVVCSRVYCILCGTKPPCVKQDDSCLQWVDFLGVHGSWS